jgi:putative tricarboxylic transport membrane protein
MTSRKTEILIAIVMFAFGAWVFYVSSSIAIGSVVAVVGPKFIPEILAVIIMVMSVLLGISHLMQREHQSLEKAPTINATKDATSKHFFINPVVRVVILICLLGGYVFALDVLGFRISSIIFVSLLLLFKGMHSPFWLSISSVALVSFLYLLFYMLLSIPLPVGSLTGMR